MTYLQDLFIWYFLIYLFIYFVFYRDIDENNKFYLCERIRYNEIGFITYEGGPFN